MYDHFFAINGHVLSFGVHLTTKYDDSLLIIKFKGLGLDDDGTCISFLCVLL